MIGDICSKVGAFGSFLGLGFVHAFCHGYQRGQANDFTWYRFYFSGWLMRKNDSDISGCFFNWHLRLAVHLRRCRHDLWTFPFLDPRWSFFIISENVLNWLNLTILWVCLLNDLLSSSTNAVNPMRVMLSLADICVSVKRWKLRKSHCRFLLKPREPPN